MSTKDLRRELDTLDLMGLALGQVIGSGIFVLVGIGILYTGRSVNLAMLLSGLWVILLSIPWIFISSCVRLRGGEYTQAAVLCGEKFAGFFIAVFLVRNLQMSVYAIGFASYFLDLFPHINGKLVALAVATFFFAINIFPTKSMAQFQNVLLILLLAGLAAFIAYGAPNMQPGYFDQPGFTPSGALGFLSASAILTFATFGANSIFQLSGECKNPKRDIPLVLITATFTVSILYAVVATIAAGVLPLEQVAGETLSNVAKTIMPTTVYYFFMIFGALIAIATSLHCTIAWVTKPIMQACEDGWFPKKLAYLHPKYKTPIILIGIYYVITISPIILGINMEMIVNMVLVLMYGCMIVTSLATMRIPKLFPEQWNKSPFKCKEGLLNFLCILAAIILAIQIYFNIQFIDPRLLIGNVVILIVAVIFAVTRHNTGKVKMDISYEND